MSAERHTNKHTTHHGCHGQAASVVNIQIGIMINESSVMEKGHKSVLFLVVHLFVLVAILKY